jgi:hypothetical protein
MNAAPGNCNSANSEVGANGLCYQYCKAGWSPVDDGPMCAKDCPAGFAPTGSTASTVAAAASLSCLKPAFQREIKPALSCPPGADRLFDKCLLDCPAGTTKKYNLCLPICPPNFVETRDGLSCQAEFVKRTATVREACYANETRLGGRFCLAPCEAGTVASQENSEMCYAVLPIASRPFFWTGDSNFKANVGPIVSKIISARSQISASCDKNYESINGQCYAKCPKGSTGYSKECFADCPSDFPSVTNQSACIRPTVKRQIVVGLLGSVEGVIGAFVAAIIKAIIVMFIVSRLNARRK